jgi:hypothetical protein
MARLATADYSTEATPDIIGRHNANEIRRILPEIQRQQKSKADYIYPSPKLAVNSMGNLIMADIETFKVGDGATSRMFTTWGEAEKAAGTGANALPIIPQKSGGTLHMKRYAHRQLCNRLNVPVDFIDRLHTEGQSDSAAGIMTDRLRLPRVINKETKPYDRLMVRTLDGEVRAVLSDQFLILDNIDLFFCAAQELEKVGAEIWQMRLSDNSFELVAFSKSISGVVTTDDGMKKYRGEAADDDGTQYAACRIGNSETGAGAVNVDSAAMTWACRNLCVRARTLRRTHIGRIAETDGVFSDETKAAESRTIWLKVRDMIRATFNPEKFGEWIALMNHAARTPIVGEVVKIVPETLAKFEIDENAQDAIIKKLFESRDYTQYGLSQAVTYTAHSEDLAGNGEIASDLETIGGDIMRASASEFAAMVAAAK